MDAAEEETGFSEDAIHPYQTRRDQAPQERRSGIAPRVRRRCRPLEQMVKSIDRVGKIHLIVTVGVGRIQAIRRRPSLKKPLPLP